MVTCMNCYTRSKQFPAKSSGATVPCRFLLRMINRERRPLYGRQSLTSSKTTSMDTRRKKVRYGPTYQFSPPILNYSSLMKIHITINNTNITLVDSDDLDTVEDIQPEANDDLSDGNDTDDDTPVQTADDIILASLESGALAGVCEVTAAVREIQNQEEQRVVEFACRGCSCDSGHNKTCCYLFSLDYHWDTLTELTHDDVDTHHTIQTTNLHGHHNTNSAERKRTFTSLATVSRTTFWFLHTINTKRFKNLKRSNINNGPVVRVYGNKDRKLKCHLTSHSNK